MIFTAHGSTGRCREAFLRGATDFRDKPVGRQALLATLDHCIADAAEAAAPPIDVTSADDLLALPYDEAGAAHVRRAIQIIERRHAEIGLTIDDIAREDGVSPEYLARLFRRRLDRSPTEYLHEVRISRAEQLLAQSRLSIYEVARECGYKTTSEFSSWFRRHRGAPPGGFRTQ